MRIPFSDSVVDLVALYIITVVGVSLTVSVYAIVGKQCMMGGHSLGGACGHIKAYG